MAMASASTPVWATKSAASVGVGQQLRMIELAGGADAVFLARLTSFQRTEATQLALDRNADGVGHFHDFAGRFDVVGVAGRRLAVGAQRAIHHHAREAAAHRLLADGRRGAVILVQADRNVRVLLDGRLDQLAQERLAGVLAGAGRGLQDDRAVAGFGRLHDGLDLLQVIDVEGRQTVAVIGGVVEQLAQGNESHVASLVHDVADEPQQVAGVAPFVVVPGHDLDEAVVERHAGFGVEHAWCSAQPRKSVETTFSLV